MGVILCVFLFCAGVKWRYILPLPLAGLGGLLLVALTMPERKARLLAFLNADTHQNMVGKGYQQLQALIALGSGGLSGLGLGNSRQKMNFLPESTTDFIFPIIGEEMGLWISLAVVLSFLVLTLCSGWITLHAPDPTGVLLGTGITTLLALQAIVNLGVVTSLLPNKGLPLPFISYGGSNLMLCLLCVGILFNLQRQGIYEQEVEDSLLLSRESLRV
jgi:cell division protein FtsW